MLYAKFSPAISVNISKDPFNPNVIEAEYVYGIASGYPMGGTSVNINVWYGRATLNENEKVTSFEKAYFEFIELGSADINQWGTDDSYILQKIVERKGLTYLRSYEGF